MVVYGGDNYYHEDTFHAGILSLPAGSWLVFDRSGPRWRKYWEPEFRPELVPRKPQEAFEALRELLFEAVECRLAGSSAVAVELSGGLDSSAVTAIAARCLEKRGRSVVAISAVLPEETRGQFKDERGFIDEFQSWPNIAIRYVTAEGRGPFDSIEDPSRFVVYPMRTSRFYLYEAFEQAALSGGADLMLQGNMGEAGPTCHADRHYTELAVKFRWPSLVRDLRKLREVRGTNPFRFLAGRFRDMLRPFPGWPAPPFVLLNSDFRRNGKVHPPFRYRGPDVRGYQEAMLRYRLRQHAIPRVQTAQGHLRTSEPLLDKRVLEFCLAVPSDLCVRNGYNRYLIRGALDGILPRRIQWRTDKVAFSPDYFVRFNAQLGKAREFVAAIGSTDPVRSVIDVDRLRPMLQPVGPNSRSPIARDVVPGTIYTICFLRQFAEFRP